MKYRTGYATEFAHRINTCGNKFMVDSNKRPINTLKEMIETSALLYSENTAFWQKFKGSKEYTPIKYKQVLADVNSLGTALHSHGMKDKHIAVIGENGYYWALSYLATACGTGVVVPIDKELSFGDIRNLLEASDAACVFFSPKYRKVFEDMPSASDMLLVEMSREEPPEGMYSITSMIEEGNRLLEEGNTDFTDAEIDTDAMSILLFTSGTTGVSKGVMLSQRNICSDLMSAPNLVHVYEDDLFFSVLPMHHTYECTAGFLMPLYKGASIGYCEGLKYIQKNLKELHPTIFLGVPLIFEKLYNSIWKNIRKQNKEKNIEKVLKLSKLVSVTGFNPAATLLKEITSVFGSKLRLIISGGAAINPEILDFFNALGIPAVQGYGLTECSPITALNPEKREYMRNSSAGVILPGFQVKIVDAAEDGIGEICLKGDHVMLGYYNNPEATADCLIDGWFHTGDLGYVDEDDYIYITGRKKSVIIAPNGKNVFPEELEYKICESLLVDEAFVWPVNDDRGQDKAIAATIKPDMAEIEARLGADYSHDDMAALIHSEIDKINLDLPAFKKITKVIVRMKDFDKTTAHKIKRFSEDNRGQG